VNLSPDRKKTILILSATAGAGHVRAGEALLETAKALKLPLNVIHKDILNFTSPLFKKIYSEVYFTIVNTSPELWGYFYKRAERKDVTKIKSPLLKLFDQFNYKKYLQELDSLRPDAVLCTHFLPYLAITDKIATPGWMIPFFSVPTDYDAHSLWIHPSVKRYYVATEETAWTLKSNGMSPSDIQVTGIPVMPSFSDRPSKTKARASLRFPTSSLTIMIASGGYGIGVIDNLVPSVAEFLSGYSRRHFHLIVPCGKNNRLYDKLSRTTFPENVRVTLYRYISFMDRLMDCSDILISKAGGLTVSEGLAKHLPMIIFDPIPGQEGRNTDYIVEHGAGIRAGNLANLHFKLKEFIEKPSLVMTMRKNAGRIATPEAARMIWEDLLQRI
jgi:processive 1,2-diacylglycerol beta-glucosyltransferase